MTFRHTQIIEVLLFQVEDLIRIHLVFYISARRRGPGYQARQKGQTHTRGQQPGKPSMGLLHVHSLLPMQVFPWLYIPLSNITDEMSRARFPVFIKNILKSDQNSREGARRLHSRLPPCMKLRLCLPYSAGRTSTSSVSPSRMDFSLGRSSPVFSSRPWRTKRASGSPMDWAASLEPCQMGSLLGLR